MVSVKLSFVFWGLVLILAQVHFGESLFLGYKKELLKHKLYKLKEALTSAHHDVDEIHYHYKPYYSGYSKYSPSYSLGGYSKYSPSYSLGGYSKYSSYGSYGWPSYSGYSGWSGHY